MELSITSASFAHQGEIPRKYSCQGDDVSPPLSWSNLPAGTKTLALIVDDPDAPVGTWVHWVLFNIPATVDGLPEAVKVPPAGTQQGTNSWKRTGYGGPCPPFGRHRYFHKLYALDTRLEGLTTPTSAELQKAMGGHILAQAELIGTYAKTGK